MSKSSDSTMDSKNQELADLLARCTLRDQKALQSLYNKVHRYLYATIYRMLKSQETSEEVLQEAFVQIWENAERYQAHLSQPLTWMTSIARYRALDRLDKDKRYAKRFQENDSEIDIIESTAACNSESPESVLQQTQLGKHIHKCLSGLTDKVQESIKLAYLEGFSRDEIAETLQTNANTVKSWLRRGSERLKKCLEAKVELAQ